MLAVCARRTASGGGRSTLDSSIIPLYSGLHDAQVLAGRIEESRRTPDLIGRRAPGNPLLLAIELQEAAAQHDRQGAEGRAETNIAAAAGHADLVLAFEQMSGIVMTQGRLEEAERYWPAQLALSATAESWGRRLSGARQLGYSRLHCRSDAVGAVGVVDPLL